jgi:creatinine amidohydrolase/Fe(II)-dependent formamide hydrolase-like protein
MFLARLATADDDLGALWPESPALNPERVLLVTGENETILAGAVLFDGGHHLLYVGTVKILDTERPQWVARTLWRAIAKWAKERGIAVVGHGAQTETCMEAMERLGGTAVTRQILYEVAL